MADEKTRNADFIGRVVGDAKNPTEARMLTGWFGDSGEEGFRRLYTDAELTSFIDIPADAILYSEAIRDVQPSGGVLVWIKRDAAVKQGGSAFSRAARFLQGQIQQDFGSGTGSASADASAGEQPNVGGCWPCITAIPHCAEPTGFTGKCTELPWPNPTRYVACTIYHCPTNDLTCIPQICHIVASGMPGCGGVVEQPAGEKSGAEKAAVVETQLPGCGFTKIWGNCGTQFGCGLTHGICPTETVLLGCGWSRNPICTDLPGCGPVSRVACNVAAPQAAAPLTFTIHPLCTLINCGPAETIGCMPGGLQGPGGGGAALTPTPPISITMFFCCNPSQVNPPCPTGGIDCTVVVCPTHRPRCHTFHHPICPSPLPVDCTRFGPLCISPLPIDCTRFGPECPPHTPLCPVTPGAPQCPPFSGVGPCITQLGCPPSGIACGVSAACQPGGSGVAQQAAFHIRPTVADPWCPYPSEVCTFVHCPTRFCPVGGGVAQQAALHIRPTVADPWCPYPSEVCTHVGCPTRFCPVGGGGVAQQAAVHIRPTLVDPWCPYPSEICTHVGCPTRFCPVGGGVAQQAAFHIRPTVADPWCPYPSEVCTFVHCPTRFCPVGGGFAPAQPGGGIAERAAGAAGVGGGGPSAIVACGVTQIGCTVLPLQCQTQVGHPGCWTGALVCTQFGLPCPSPHPVQCTPLCPTHFECTPFCPSQIVPCHTPMCTKPPQCPIHSAFECPSLAGCPSGIACNIQQPAQQEAFRAGGAALPNTAAGCGIQPTNLPWCPRTQQCPTHFVDCTVFCPTRFPQCTHFGPNCLTHFADCTFLCPTFPVICPIPTGLHCPTPPLSQPPQCPMPSGFECPSVAGCPSIACVSQACQPGGGGGFGF